MPALIQIIGFVLVTAGVWLVYPPAAFIVAGLFVAAFGVALERVRNAGSST